MHDNADSVKLVWDAYLNYHPRAVLSPERIKLIQRRLEEGYPVDLLVDAVVGNHADAHSNGENDRRTEYHSLGLILRDADRIERFAAVAEVARPRDPVESAWQMYKRWAAQSGAVTALDRVMGNYPDEVVAEVKRRVEGDELGRRRA